MNLVPSGGVDLHLHSIYSDGSDSPEQLLHKAADLGLRAIAITDHDDLRAHQIGLDSTLGVELIPGIELSTIDSGGREIHVLGYLIDVNHKVLNTKLTWLRTIREERIRSLLRKINHALTMDYELPQLQFEEVKQLSHGAIGRPHVAEAMVRRGIVTDWQAAFDQFLIPLNVPKAFFPIQEAIGLIRAAGGIPVLAHPARMLADPHYLTTLVSHLSVLGLRGIEVYTSSSTLDEQTQLAELADRFNLLITGGSDYHGDKSSKKMGCPFVHYFQLQQLREEQTNRSLQKRFAALAVESAGLRVIR